MIDFLVLIGYLAITLGLGLWWGRGQRSMQTFLLGDRNMPWLALLASIVATETSSVTFLSIPGLSYAEGGAGFRFLQLTLGYILGRIVVTFVFLPLYMRGKLFTAYQVLDQRFGGRTKQAASLLFLVMRNLADGLRLYLTALILEQLLEVNLVWAILILAAVTTAYTLYGGLRSVVWNDCLQLAIYLLGAAAALGVILVKLSPASSGGLMAIGQGWEALYDFAKTTGKLQFFDLTFSLTRPYTLWSGLAGGVFVALATHGTDQLMVQRYLGARSFRDAAKALCWSGPVVAAQFGFFLWLGAALAAFYSRYPAEPPIARPDAALARFIIEELPPGLSGLVVAAVIAAAMSTLSSSLNASASAAMSDFYLARRARPSEAADPNRERQLLGLSRAFTGAFAACQIAVALSGPSWARAVVENVMAIATFTSGVILGVFFLGVLTTRVSEKAALVGLLAGLGVNGAIVWGTTISWPWYAVIGSVVTFALGYAASFVPGISWPRRRKQADEK